MKKVWIAADCVVSPLGNTTLQNYQNLREGNSGIHFIDERKLGPEGFYGARIRGLDQDGELTKFESICCQAIQQVMDLAVIPVDRTIFILSTTKGNIAFLEEGLPKHPRIHLHAVAGFLAGKFGFKKYFVVSNACISGLMALIVGKRIIASGQYDHAVVVGADTMSRFVISGFQSLQALSSAPCRPFDAARQGINLGECAAAIVLTSNPEELKVKPTMRISGGGFSNDANHISGPSRTGEELVFAMQQALVEAEVSKDNIDFISAHGTATLYNDEMEAKAFNMIGMDHVPMNSLKGYFGHTLGAAGIVEIAMSAQSLVHNELIASAGFETLGVSETVNVIQKLEKRPLKMCLKTASGFGGCNAAVIIKKENNF